MKGQWTPPVDEWEKDRFLELYADGLTPTEAARELDKTGSTFRRVRNPKSHWYDAEFTARFEELRESHENSKLERLQDATFNRALESSDRLAEKWLMAMDPEWERLFKPQNFQNTFSIETLKVELAQMPREMLEMYRERLLEAKKRDLPVLEA